MDRLERQEELSVLLREALAGWQSGMWTALPAIVQSYDPSKMTCTAQPAIKFEQLLPDGSWSPPANMPLLEDVPVVFPAGGGFALTFPIAKGDEVLVIIASRCIDVWWQNGGIQPQARPRMHDLSDAFAIPGPFSQPRKLAGVSTTKVQLRSTSGADLIEIDPTLHRVNILAVGGLWVNGIQVVVP